MYSGAFESYPTFFSLHEAHVLIDGTWLSFHPAEIHVGAALLSKAAFDRRFGRDLPELPAEAFQNQGGA
jgi:hypothetical protein